MTNAEKQEIIEAVLAALATNSKTIAQLSPKQSLIDSDLFEVAGGSRVTYAVLRELIRDGLALASQLSNYVTGDAAMTYLAKLDTETGTVDYKESPLVMLDGFKGVNGYSPIVGNLFYENYHGFQIWIKNAGGAEEGIVANPNVAYVNKNDNHIYRWTGTTMQRIGGGGGDGSSVLEDVYIDGTDLVMVFNTSEGEETVRINISGAFDPSNYYDKSDVDTLLEGKVPTTRKVNGKALSSNITIGINDIDGLAEAIAAAGSGAVSVSVPDPADGTFTINVGSNSYTINLNHTHPNMAKLVVCEESDLPSTLEEDTIYGVDEDGEISVLYVGGIPFYGGGGGGTSTPVLRQPTDGSTIDVGKIESGESSVTKTITVKGKNLTQPLTVAVTGTGYSVNKQTISAADANVGTTLTITCTSTADDAAGTLSLASSEVSCDCDLVANASVYESISAAKFTKQQIVDTGIVPGANTRLEFDIQFSGDFSSFSDTTNYTNVFISTQGAGSPSQYVSVNFGNLADNTGVNIPIFFWIGKEVTGVEPKIIVQKADTNTRATLKINNPTKTAEYLGETTTFVGLTIDCGGSLRFGGHRSDVKKFAYKDIILYGIKHYESDVLVNNLVPMLKNGIAGLRDTVTGTFISSVTATELVAIS